MSSCRSSNEKMYITYYVYYSIEKKINYHKSTMHKCKLKEAGIGDLEGHAKRAQWVEYDLILGLIPVYFVNDNI